MLALWLELRLSKSDILELYLNRVYFGAGAHGIEAAAERYFAKSARELTIAEAAIIAGLLKAPSKYAPTASPTLALARGRVVLEKMRETGAITAEQERAAASEQIRFSALMRGPEQADMGYAVDYVLERASSFENTDTDEIVIETTLDANLQRRAGEILVEGARSRRQGPGSRPGGNGRARARRRHPGAGRRALLRREPVQPRRTGEAPARLGLQAGRLPDRARDRASRPTAIVKDEPITIKGWSPKNDNGRYLGTTTLREALVALHQLRRRAAAARRGSRPRVPPPRTASA